MVIPNGFEAGEVITMHNVNDHQRTRTVLCLGRLHPLKGLDLLVSAWAEVKKCANAGMRECGNGEMRECGNEFTWQLVIAGPDEQGTKGKLKIESEKLKLKWCEGAGMDACEWDSDIVFFGAVHGEEKWTLMQRADIFVLPSRSENFGMVVGEALSCGVPVVTTAVGPWGEGSGEMRECGNGEESGKVVGKQSGSGDVRKCANAEMRECGNAGEVGASKRSPVLMEKRGLIVVETSVEGIAKGLRRMMALSDAERHEMGMQGCKWVKSAFSWESVAKQMVEAYDNARMRECVNAGI